MNNTETYISSYDIHLFHEGNHFKSYEFLGSKFINTADKQGAFFTLWAPNAEEVRIVGNFNNWSGEKHLMKKIDNSGLWTLFIANTSEGDIYKYEIHTKNNEVLLKSDPYAFYSELRPNTASTIIDIDKYQWNDANWLEERKNFNAFTSPINIYEVHLGSWKKTNTDDLYSYRELADMLIDYVISMGYTHIQILPLCEHPLDISWGYQCTGYYSLTSRFGTPEDFMYFVNKFHQNGIGIILDWVPGHFCKDTHGLYKFDGSFLYEYEDEIKRENYDWGTANFDLGKNEVQSFLISNAVFWLEKYHIDGLRVDAVANMLYLNYGKKEHLDFTKHYGTNTKIESVKFLNKLNEVLFEYFDNPLVIAEESTSWPLVTAPTYDGGLGFNYKWNMGWMNDMLKYMSIPPTNRKYFHKLLTFSLMYTFSENFILPLSHDEVVHGKKSIINKMPGTYEEKFANIRMFYAYMMCHPGKKLLFMGGELGQFVEWKDTDSLDWQLIEYNMHKKLHLYVKTLNVLYKKESCLWQQDHNSNGFNWINHGSKNDSIISFIRRGIKKDDFIIVVCNFGSEFHMNYTIGVPRLLYYKEIFNSNNDCFGGSNIINKNIITPINEEQDNNPYCIKINLAPLTTLFIKPVFRDIKGGNLIG